MAEETYRFGVEEVEQAARTALLNWDFDVIEEDKRENAVNRLRALVANPREAAPLTVRSESTRGRALLDWLRTYSYETGAEEPAEEA